jgi:uncharacterized protein YdaU (DUF1376 family)
MSKTKPPAFQFYASDFLTDTMDWTDEQVGAHVRLMAWSWVNRRGIPRDTQRMSRISPAAPSAWEVIGDKWKEGPDETWINERLEGTRTDNDAFRARQKEKSDLAAVARKEKGTTGGRKPKSKKTPADIPKEEPVDVSTGIPLEGEGEEEVLRKSGKERARKGPDPNVQGVIDHLTARLKDEGIAQSLDGNATSNRWAAHSLILKLKKDYPDHDPLVSAKALIDAALADPFHRRNATTVKYLYNNCGKIAASYKTPNATGQARNPDPATAARNVDEYFARKREGAAT